MMAVVEENCEEAKIDTKCTMIRGKCEEKDCSNEYELEGHSAIRAAPVISHLDSH
jgi:hypothetical protein